MEHLAGNTTTLHSECSIPSVLPVRACPLTPPLENGHYNETFAPIGQSVRAICDRCHRANVTLLRCGQDGNFEQPYPVCDRESCDMHVTCTLLPQFSHVTCM